MDGDTCDGCHQSLDPPPVYLTELPTGALIVACSSRCLRRATERAVREADFAAAKAEQRRRREEFQAAQQRRGSRPRRPRSSGAGRRPSGPDLREVLGDGDGDPQA